MELSAEGEFMIFTMEAMMKNAMVVMAAAVLLLSAGTATALDSATVTVSAVVAPTCKFSAPATATLSFGVLDPASPADVNASAILSFWCTDGTAYTIGDDDGLYETGVNANRMRSSVLAVPEFIPYTLTYGPASGAGTGPASPITLTLTGSLLGIDYASRSPDVYNDTVTLTVTP